MNTSHDIVTREVTRYMRATGLSQAAMATAIGLRQPALSKRINGALRWSLADLDRLAIIRALRAANYSLAAILRLLDALDRDATADIGHVLDHPDPDDDILSVCDRLLTSLDAAERNAFEMIELLERMKKLA